MLGWRKLCSSECTPSYDICSAPQLSLSQIFGQPHDADYALLYALYKLDTDVSGCVHKGAGDVTGAGWRMTTMDPDAEVTHELAKQIQAIERWLKSPPKLFVSTRL